jgi:hypothetical protein
LIVRGTMLVSTLTGSLGLFRALWHTDRILTLYRDVKVRL